MRILLEINHCVAKANGMNYFIQTFFFFLPSKYFVEGIAQMFSLRFICNVYLFTQEWRACGQIKHRVGKVNRLQVLSALSTSLFPVYFVLIFLPLYLNSGGLIERVIQLIYSSFHYLILDRFVGFWYLVSITDGM